MVIGFPEIGKGHQPMVNFSRLMNMSCLTVNAFDNISKTVKEAYKFASEESMNEAALTAKQESKEKLNTGEALVQVAIDGSWQTRGHTSLNGVVTAICGGKCLDVQVMSKYCRGCQIWANKKGSTEYETWKAKHKCSLNHTKSSGAMESAGAVDIFSRSLLQYGLIYKYYLGDGDSSSFNDVVASKPYDVFSIIPEKLECVGHVQKRIGSRLRNRRKVSYGDKKLSGKGRLTEASVNTLQNAFGIAVRQTAAKQNLTDEQKVYQMKKNIKAVLRHYTDFEDKSHRHILCPIGPDSWCKWKKSKNADADENYSPKLNLPEWIYEIIKKDFDELSNDDLLKKCLHGQTQNCNEGLNNIIWSRCPKNVYVKTDVLEMGVNSAVLSFNEGSSGIYRVFKHLNLDLGKNTITSSVKKDQKRLQNMVKKGQPQKKRRRKDLRGIRKGWIDKDQDQSSKNSYEKGCF
jgi:hypothetical protein